MPKSVPPTPWKLSRRGTPAIAAVDVVVVVAGAGVITAVADAADPLGAGRPGWGVRTRGGWRGRWWRARAGRAGRGRRQCRRAPHLLERRDVDRGDDAALC